MSESWKPDFPNWKDRFPDLVWWMDMMGDRKVPRGAIGAQTRSVRDHNTGQMWEMSIDHRGLPVKGMIRDKGESFKFKRSELKYEVWQYALIVWGLQKIIFEGWNAIECYHVIKHFWRNLPGQAPLVINTVAMWTSRHKKFKKEGILWP